MNDMAVLCEHEIATSGACGKPISPT